MNLHRHVVVIVVFDLAATLHRRGHDHDSFHRTAADQSLTDWGSGKRSPNFTIEMTGASDDFFGSSGAQAQNAAGLVVAFARSPRVAVAHVRIDHADLTALLTVPVYQ